MDRLRHIKDLVFKHTKRYIVGIFCLIIVDILQLATPRIFGLITDQLEMRTFTRSTLLVYSLLLVGIAVGIATFRFFWRYFIFGSSRIIEADLRDRLYAHLQKLSINYYNHNKTGDLMAHATNDINNIRMAFGSGIAVSLDSLLIPVAALIMMLNVGSIGLTLICFIPLVLLAVGTGFFMRIMHKSVENMQAAFSTMTETAQENFSGIRVIKAFAREVSEMKKFNKANLHNRAMNMKYVRMMSLMNPLIMTIASVSLIIGWWYGGVLVIYGDMSLGGYVAYNTYLGMLIWPIASIGWLAGIFQRGAVSLDRINRILDEEPEIRDGPNVVNIDRIRGKIVIKDLDFTYPGGHSPVLKGINLTIEEGQTLAIVGRTGSGKSTLANLLLRLYNVEDGRIFIDGYDINRIPLSVLRKSIGYVPQEPFLFSTTIRDNIDFYRNASDEEIIRASKIAGVYSDIMEFPYKFNTIVGERGVTLSGGQKQRISIAKAIIGSPPILLFDDCLSAVDTRTEEEILKGLSKIMENVTSIIISHRISSIKDADQIIVLDEGRIAEFGTHDELLAMEGIYYELYQKQLLSDKLEVNHIYG